MRRPTRSIVSWISLSALLAFGACQGEITSSQKGNGQAGEKPGSGAKPGDSSSGQMPGDPSTGAPATTPGAVSAVPMRRLTKAQYHNTIRDLLGFPPTGVEGFGLDEKEGGFDANSKAPLKELQIEKYQAAAEELAGRAVANLERLAPCADPAGAQAACLDAFLDGFGKRAYRRPLTDEERAAYKEIFTLGRDPEGGFVGGIRLVVATMLQSPYFLYRPELGTGTPGPGGEMPLTQYEIASRLSYFLQNTMPDAALFEAADAGELGTPEEIATHAERLLKDEKARGAMVSFFRQWLEIEDLETLEKDTEVYPQFTDEVREAMIHELDEFVDRVVRQGDGKLETLLTANYSFLSEPLFDVYGVEGADGAGAGTNPARVNLPEAERAGILTLAPVMARHGYADQSSPVGRGYVVSDRLLCRTPPPPPDDVVNEVPKPDPNVSTRVRFEMHRTNPECATCHTLMDPLGIPFEIYDGMGRYRERDGSQMVDAASELEGTSNDGPVKDAIELVGRLAAADEVKACMARQWFRYAFGRLDGKADEPFLQEAVSAFGSSGDQLPDLMVALTKSRVFSHRSAIAR